MRATSWAAFFLRELFWGCLDQRLWADFLKLIFGPIVFALQILNVYQFTFMFNNKLLKGKFGLVRAFDITLAS